MEQQLYGTRRAGSPKLRWVDIVAQDDRNMGINNWKTAAQDNRKMEETCCGSQDPTRVVAQLMMMMIIILKYILKWQIF
jgi:hypothetical protein